MHRTLFITLFLCYLFAGIIAPLCHSHETDGHFHDNCPACQWELSHQNDVPKTSGALGVTPLQWTVLYTDTPQTLSTQYFHNYGTIRAPPLYTLI